MKFLPRWCVQPSSITPSTISVPRAAGGEASLGGGDILDSDADIESLGLGRLDRKLYPSKTARTHLTNALATVLVIVAVGGGWYLSRDYLRQVLLWVAVQEAWAVVLVFLALFTIVSFPFMWGYILVNISAGYMFGTWRGLAVVVSTATLAVLIVHTLLRCCLREVLQRRVMSSNVLRALLAVLGGSQAFKVIATTRLTPIPFGLQNAVFAVSRVSTWLYLCATVLGLLPTQVLNCYLGTTVRSLDEVVSDSASATATGWIVFAAQILISIGLTLWVVRRAKAELHSTMAMQLVDAASTMVSSSLPCSPKRHPVASEYRRASHADVATISTPAGAGSNVYGFKKSRNRSNSLFLELLPNNLKVMGLNYGFEVEKPRVKKEAGPDPSPVFSPASCSTASSFVQRSCSSDSSGSSSSDDDFILLSGPDHPA